MLKRRRWTVTLLAAAALVPMLAACRTEPAAPGLSFVITVDPASGTVQRSALAPQRTLAPGAELDIADFSYAFEPGNLLVIDVSFRNTSSDLKYRNFRFVPGGRGYIESREPILDDDQLGRDGFLVPTEVTPPLRFEVIHRGAPFTYFVNVDADVIEIPADLGDPEALGGGPLLLPEQGNCMVNELVTREQGYRVSGGVGGLAIDDPAGPFDISPVVTAGDLAAQIAAVLGDVQPNDNVALMVVDDFAPAALDPAVFELSAADLDPSFADPFDALDRILDELVEAGGISHGPLVLLHTVALLNAMPGVSYVGTRENVMLFELDVHHIAVVAVDTQGLRTDVIAEAIDQAYLDLVITVPAPAFPNVVVNMSFNVIPCSVLTDYNASGAASFDEYLDQLADANDLQDLKRELAELITTAFLPDALNVLTDDFPAPQRAVFVGSAGNFGNDFVNPFTLAPALWPSVVGVASLDGVDSAPSVFANPGEVAFGGAWIVLEDALRQTYPEPGGLAPFTRTAGSSFAAPGVAVFSALDLASEARCWPTGTSDEKASLLATGVAGYGENALALAVARSCAAQ